MFNSFAPTKTVLLLVLLYLMHRNYCSYRYATRKGLSTKILTVYDLELPDDFVPFNGDGEVEEFMLMPIQEALQSIRYAHCKYLCYRNLYAVWRLVHICV
jgi:hypothetical protein